MHYSLKTSCWLVIVLVVTIPNVFPDKIEICATTSDLGALVKEMGREHVLVTVFAKAMEDPHFVDPKPSFIKRLNKADLLIQTGLELELGWLPPLLKNARNRKILPGGSGHIMASTVIDPLGIAANPVDRSMGDVHASGNPHYLLDPLNGLKVAQLISEKLGQLKPEKKNDFFNHFKSFKRAMGAALVGEVLAKKYDFEKLALLFEHGKLKKFLESQNESLLLGGWLGQLLPYYGTKVIGDHDLYPYFSRRFGIVVSGHLEPLPGIPPTTRHLRILVKEMKNQNIHYVLTVPYYQPRHIRFISSAVKAKVIPIAHQVGARPNTDDYLKMTNHNVEMLVKVIKERNEPH